MKILAVGFFALRFGATAIGGRANLTFDAVSGSSRHKVESKAYQITDRANSKLVAFCCPNDVKIPANVLDIYPGSFPYLAMYAYDDTETYDRRIDYFWQYMDATANWGTSGGHADMRRASRPMMKYRSAQGEAPLRTVSSTSKRTTRRRLQTRPYPEDDAAPSPCAGSARSRRRPLDKETR